MVAPQADTASGPEQTTFQPPLAQGKAPCADYNLHSQNDDPDSRCQLVCLQIKIGLYVLFSSRILDNFWKSLKALQFSDDCKCEKASTMRAIEIVLCMTRIACRHLPKLA